MLIFELTRSSPNTSARICHTCSRINYHYPENFCNSSVHLLLSTSPPTYRIPVVAHPAQHVLQRNLTIITFTRVHDMDSVALKHASSSMSSSSPSPSSNSTSSSSSPLPSSPSSPLPTESPISETATNARFPATPSTGAIWAELATLTVTAFNESLIHRLHQFITKTPHFSTHHLHMLGPIVVRHVTLQLQDIHHSNQLLPNMASTIHTSDPDHLPTLNSHYSRNTCSSTALCNCPCSSLNSSKPVTNAQVHTSNISTSTDAPVNDRSSSPLAIRQRPRSLQLCAEKQVANCNTYPSLSSRPSSEIHKTLPKRPSLRDVAYQAVRLRRILPSTGPSEVDDLPKVSPLHTDQFARRISITTPAFQCPQQDPVINSSATATPLKQPDIPVRSEPTFRNKHQSARHLDTFVPTPSRIPKPHRKADPPKAPPNSEIINLDAIADAHVGPEVPACDLSHLSEGQRPGAYMNTAGKLPLKLVDANKPASPRTPHKKCMQTWRAQSGLPETSRLPRAGADAILESGSARTLKYQQRRERLESSSTEVAASKLYRKSRGAFPAIPTTSSRLMLLRRQRERRRSSLR